MAHQMQPAMSWLGASSSGSSDDETILSLKNKATVEYGAVEMEDDEN